MILLIVLLCDYFSKMPNLKVTERKGKAWMPGQLLLVSWDDEAHEWPCILKGFCLGKLIVEDLHGKTPKT